MDNENTTNNVVENENTEEVENSQEIDTGTDNRVESEDDNANIDTDNKKEVIKSFTQEQVNNIVRDRLERQANKFYKKFGVKDEDEFGNLIGMQQAYSVMKERYSNNIEQLKNANEKLAYIENNISPNRYDDVRTYFKGKGIEFNDSSLKEELKTHPEWLQIDTKDNSPVTTIEKLGLDHEDRKAKTEDEKLKEVFGI